MKRRIALTVAALTAACGGLLGLDEDDETPPGGTSGGDAGSDGGSLVNDDASGSGEGSAPDAGSKRFCDTVTADFCWDWDDTKPVDDRWNIRLSVDGGYERADDASTSTPSSLRVWSIDDGSYAELTVLVAATGNVIDLTFTLLVPDPIPGSTMFASISPLSLDLPALAVSADETQARLSNQSQEAGASVAFADPIPHDRFVHVHLGLSFVTQHALFDIDGVNPIDQQLKQAWTKGDTYRVTIGVRQYSGVIRADCTSFIDNVVIRRN